MAEEGDKEVLLNTHPNRRDVRDLEPMAVNRESGDMRKDAINILGLSVLYPWIGMVGG
jgi:hypothetical protein